AADFPGGRNGQGALLDPVLTPGIVQDRARWGRFRERKGARRSPGSPRRHRPSFDALWRLAITAHTTIQRIRRFWRRLHLFNGLDAEACPDVALGRFRAGDPLRCSLA